MREKMSINEESHARQQGAFFVWKRRAQLPNGDVAPTQTAPCALSAGRNGGSRSFSREGENRAHRKPSPFAASLSHASAFSATMTTTRDGSIDTVVSGGLPIPSHTVNRSATFDAQEKKCFYCRQDRQKVMQANPPCQAVKLTAVSVSGKKGTRNASVARNLAILALLTTFLLLRTPLDGPFGLRNALSVGSQGKR